MRGSWALILVFSLTTASITSITSSASARDKKHKHKAETEEPAEPAPDPEPPPAEEPPPQDTSSTEGVQDSTEPATSNDGAENVAASDAAEDATAPKEAPKWFFGASLHGVWVPSFMLGLFLDGPPTIGNLAFGAQVTHRDPKDGFSWVLGLGYTSYSFEGALHKTGDPDEDTEWVKSSLGMVHVTGAILWATQFSDMFSLEYGIGADFGVVTGSLERDEAYKKPTGGYAPCAGALNPPVLAASGVPYCQVAMRNGVPVTTNNYNEYGEQYHVKEKRIPPVALLPALPILALRFSPVRNVAVKLEGAYGIFQFWFGISAAYGVDL